MSKILIYITVSFTFLVNCYAASCSDYTNESSCNSADWCSWEKQNGNNYACDGNLRPSNSPYIEDVMINEVNVDSGYIELFFNKDTDVSGWKLKVNYRSGGSSGNTVVECPAFPSGSNYTKDTFFITYNSSNGSLETYGSPKFDCNTVNFHQNQNEVVLYDDQDRLVHYVSAWNGGSGSGSKIWPYEDGDTGATIMDDDISGNYDNVCSLPDGDIGEPEWDVDSGCSGTPGFTNNGILVDDNKVECPTAAFDNIQDAINASSDGQEIIICSGTYNENITINKKNLTLISQTQNRSDVTISGSSSNSVVTITNWPESITLKDLSIVQNNNNQYGIYISSQYPSQFTKFDNISVVSQNWDAINFNWQSNNFSLIDSYLKTTTDGDGIDFGNSNDGGFDLNNTTIDAADNGIEISGSFNNGVNIVDSNITTLQGRSLDLGGNIWNNGLNISNSTIYGMRGIYTSNSIGGGLNVSNTNITTTGTSLGDNGIYIAGEISNGTIISNTNINSARYGAYFGDELNGNVNINNLKIESEKTAMHFNQDVWNGCDIDNTNISSKERGIEFIKNVSGTFTINDVNVTSEDESLFFNDSATNPVITNTNIISKNENAIYTQSDNWTNFTLQNSCIKTEKSNKHALYIDIRYLNSSSDINNNCFYAENPNELGYAKDTSSGSKFNSNYWDEHTGNYSYNNISDTSTLSSCPNSCAQNSTPIPVIEYHMDECEWDGSNGDVDDNSSNGYNATSKGDAKTVDQHKIGRSGYFDGDSDYIEQSKIYDYLKTTSSLSFWIKTTQTGASNPYSSPGITGIEENGGLDDIFWGWLDRSGHIGITAKSNETNVKSLNPINDNNWHHIVLTRDANSGKVQLYVNGNLEGSATHGTGDVGNSFSKIGRMQNAANPPEYFEGYLDEVKIYDKVLSSGDITQIYSNENSGKNYDGATRDEISCALCSANPGYSFGGIVNDIQMVGDIISIKDTYNDSTFTEKTYKDNFVFSKPPVIFILPDKNGANPASMRVKNVDTRGFDIAITEPQGEDGAHIAMNVDYFAINQGIFTLGDSFLEVGTIETKAVQKGYDTATNSWVTITPSVKFCNPVVLVQVQGMANEPGYVPNGISQPFLSAVVDSNSSDGTIKIALEMGETELGTISQNETIAYMIAESNIQSSFIDDADNNIKFETIKTGPIFYGWDDTGDVGSASFVHNFTSKPLVAASLNSRNSLDGGWFRKKAHNKSNISLVVDEDRLNRNPKGTYQDTERSKKKNGSDNTHTPEVGGIFAFEGTFIKNAKADAASNFNALDEGQGLNETDLNTGYITTKIVGESFKLDIIAREDDNITKSDANITKLEIVECVDEACVDCKITSEAEDLSTTNFIISNSTGYITTSNLTVNEAYKLAKIRITGISSTEEVTVCSSDLFSVRPKKFEFSVPSSAYASEEFNINFFAKDFSNNAAVNYNETIDSSFSVDYNISKTECNIGTMDLENFSFTDGQKNNVKVNYSNLGILSLKIEENLGNEYAIVDKYDTDDSQRLIESFTGTIEVKPYELNITVADMNSSTGTNWLYMANIDDMNLTTSSTVTAFNKEGNILLDFNSTCFAKDVDLSFDLHTSGLNALDMNYTITDGIFSIGSFGTTLGDLDKTITINASNFVDGKGSAGYAFNVYRNYFSPIEPFNIGNMQVSINTIGIAKNVNGATNNGSFDFYFGRASVSDIKTTKSLVNHFIEFEVYDPDNTLGFTKNSLNWSKNESHNNAKYGDITNADFTSEPSGITSSVSGFHNGKLEFILNGSTSATIHVDVDEWLWYIPFNCGNTCKYKSFDDGGSCSNHPCFNFTYKTTNTPAGVNTGNFKGSDYNTPSRGNYERTGVKAFR